MDFSFKKFGDLSVKELFDIYQLRSDVFVVEQNCLYQDIDDKDLTAFHIMLFHNGQLVGYSRILPPGLSYREPSIGRVALKKNFRGKGTGKMLMKYNLTKTGELFKNQAIVISAQVYLETFYTALGFRPEGNSYLEDNIPHIKMRFPAD